MAEVGANYQADVTQQAATTSLLSGITSSLFKYGDGIGAFGKGASSAWKPFPKQTKTPDPLPKIKR